MAAFDIFARGKNALDFRRGLLRNSRHQHILFSFRHSRHYFDNLFRRFSRTEYHFADARSGFTLHIDARMRQLHKRQAFNRLARARKIQFSAVKVFKNSVYSFHFLKFIEPRSYPFRSSDTYLKPKSFNFSWTVENMFLLQNPSKYDLSVSMRAQPPCRRTLIFSKPRALMKFSASSILRKQSSETVSPCSMRVSRQAHAGVAAIPSCAAIALRFSDSAFETRALYSHVFHSPHRRTVIRQIVGIGAVAQYFKSAGKRLLFNFGKNYIFANIASFRRIVSQPIRNLKIERKPFRAQPPAERFRARRFGSHHIGGARSYSQAIFRAQNVGAKGEQRGTVESARKRNRDFSVFGHRFRKLFIFRIHFSICQKQGRLAFPTNLKFFCSLQILVLPARRRTPRIS